MEILRNWQDGSQGKLEYLRWMSLFPSIYQLSRHIEKYTRLIRAAERRPEELYRVSCLLAPRVDEALTGAGQHFDAPPALLNIGLHWILRELVRMNVLEGDHLLADWASHRQRKTIRYRKECICTGKRDVGGDQCSGLARLRQRRD